MFYLYHHHDLKRLAGVLSILRRQLGSSPLAPDRVLVPNAGLGRWLKMHLAQADGIAANIDARLPAPFFWNLIADSLPGGRPDSSAYRRENLRWHLYAQLPDLARQVPAVAGYIGDPPGELARWQLAERLADLFDAYLIYRRDMLLEWERGAAEEAPPGSWQAPLWRALTSRLGPNHRASLLGELIHRVENDQPLDTARWPERLYCFALGNLPPDYLRLLYALGQRCDVHYFMHNPSDGYWGDIQRQPLALSVALDGAPLPGEDAADTGHPLLAGFGYAARDFLRLVYADEFAAIRELELAGALDYEPPAADTLLHRLQRGVITMDATPSEAGLEPGDRSFQVHACHGVLREVQVLHDQLLDLLAADPELQLRDIIVMTPDLAAFAPAVEAVFGATDGAASIPFNLSDQPRRGTHPIVQTFRALLDLPLWRFPASEIVGLIAVPAVMRRFDLDEADVDNVRRWVTDAGIRWGLDAEHRAAAGAGEWAQNSWAFGLDRLLAGVAVSDPEALIDGVAPAVDLEGGATAALGQLWLLIERLKRWRAELPKPATAAAWRERLNALSADLFAVDARDRDEQAALDTVNEALAVLGDAAAAIPGEAVSFEAVREIVDAELSAAGGRQPFLAGGVTFCGLVPLRTVPFKVVCLLGMNDGAFPRRDLDRAINLILQQPRLGDHSVRDDDRLLFLQWLLAAEDVFYVSYTGQDTQNGEALAPAIVVAELLDFVAQNQFAGTDVKAALAQLTTCQPMQPFSPRYFGTGEESPRVFTFRAAWESGAQAMFRERGDALPMVDGSRAPPAQPLLQIGLDELKRFFDHPARYCLRDVRQIELEIESASHDDDEPLALERLQEYALRRRLFASARTSGPLPNVVPERIRAQGQLPPPPLDAVPYGKVAGELNRLLPLWQRLVGDAPAETVAVEVALPCGVELVGRLGDLRTGAAPLGPPFDEAGRALRRVEARRVGARPLLGHWIDLLALAAGGDASLVIGGFDEDGQLDLRHARLSQPQGIERLNALAEVYLEGQQRPLCFLADLADTYVGLINGAKPRQPADALAKCNDHLTDDFHPHWAAGDVWFRHMMRAGDAPLGSDPSNSEFVDLAMTVYRPLTDALRRVDADVWLSAANPDGEAAS